MKLQWLKILGVSIWFLVEVCRWLERRNLINNLSADLMKKFEDVQKEIAANVQSARAFDTTNYSIDPDNRDNG